jgi:hypothetical protein
MNLFDSLYSIETNDELHMSRLLLILNEFGGDDLIPINGLTKLVKLDFFLRYPLYLEKALTKMKINTESLKIKDYEYNSVESRMIRYKYGPWDEKYRHYLNLLAAKELIKIELRKRTIYIGITQKGKITSNNINQYDSFKDMTNRAKILKRYFNKSGSNLKEFIYENFPEIINLTYGEKI